jgi:hypothetical protein
MTIFRTTTAVLLILALTGCACSDIMDSCPTNIWAKPV